MRKWLISLIVLLGTLPAFGQYTSVTGTAIDANGNIYSNGTITFDTVLGANCQSGFNFASSNTPFQNSIFSTLSGTGGISLTVADNNFMCSGSQWKVTVCNTGRIVCSSTSITITGATQNITSSLQTTISLLPVTPTNINQVGGSPVQTGLGLSNNKSLRVAIASDSFPALQPVSLPLAPPPLPAYVTGNTLLYRSAMSVYCQTNLIGCNQ